MDWIVLDDTLPPDSESYTDNTALPGKDYEYRVKAVNASGDSDYSNEFAIHTALLSKEAIAAMVSWWKLNETSGVRYDAHGTNHLTDNNTVLYAAGKQGNAADFDSANSEYLSISSNTTLQIGDNDACWWGWVKPETVVANRWIMAKYLSIEEYGIFFNASSGFTFIVRTPTEGIHGVASASAAVAGNWYFLYAYHDAVNNVMGLSVNNGDPVTAAATGGINGGSAAFTLGAYSSGASNYNGLIDEFGFVKGYVLTSAERTALYNSGNGVTYEQAVGA